MRIPLFPSPTMAWYVGKAFLIRTFAVMALLIVVLQALDLLGESGKIFAVPGNGMPELMTYIGLRVPRAVAFLEEPLRARAACGTLKRGHVDVTVTYRNDREDARAVTIDRELLLRCAAETRAWPQWRAAALIVTTA